jgi:hypothetical protein
VGAEGGLEDCAAEFFDHVRDSHGRSLPFEEL